MNLLIVVVAMWGYLSLGVIPVNGNLTDHECSESSVVTVNLLIEDETCNQEGQYEIIPQVTVSHSDTHEDVMSFVNLCDTNPCLYGGTCVLTYDQKDYRCINCPFPMTGKHCEEFFCDSTCFRLNDVVFYLYPDKAKSWDDAYFRCTTNEMEMAMIKDESTHCFLKKHFQQLYNNRIDVYHAYWIGLSRASKSHPWTWVDGTALDRYKGWSHYTLLNQNCAILENKLWDSFNMVDHECDQGQLYDYFPLCQKRFPFINKHEMSPCQPNPCLYGSTCTVIDKLNYRCDNCPFPMGGSNCADISCNRTCHRRGDTIYFEIRSATNWKSAFDICAENGMTMAMVKEENTHRFLKSNLPTHYNDQTHLCHCYWIGLHRLSLDEQWTWIDESKLGSYQDWAKQLSGNNSLCSAMCNFRDFKFGADDCLMEKDVYPLCQKRFPFLRNNRIHSQMPIG
ncbi:hypothetical protein CHUAL_007583 [Chamberlinius hualienensis]